jgi:RNA polymerase sigma-70 factor (ECF subfamily)
LRGLLLAGLAGDGAAYTAFLKSCAAALRAYVRNRMRQDPAGAEDVVQDVLLALHTKRDTYNPAEPVCPWIYAIARYRMIDHWRKTGRRGVHIALDDTDELFAQADDQATDARMDLTRLLALLPAKQQAAIRSVKLEERSVEDTAAALGISMSDVKISIHRGIKALARHVAQSPILQQERAE